MSCLWINASCEVHELDGARVAMVYGEPFSRWVVGDKLAEELFAVQAHDAGLCTIEETARALGHLERTLYRCFARYRKGGAGSVFRNPRGRLPGAGVDSARDAAAVRMRAEGLSAREIARRLGVSHPAILAAFKRKGLENPISAEQVRLPFPLPGEGPAPLRAGEGPAASAFVGGARELGHGGSVVDRGFVGPDVSPPGSPLPKPEEGEEPIELTLDTDPFSRAVDRMRAAHGELADAAPLFASGEGLPFVGALLAIPGLVASGMLPEARLHFGDIGPAFYGLRTSLVTMVLLALLRIKRPEHLKEFAPPDLGRILGLDRAPEVKTLRRKARQLADGPAETFIAGLAARRVKGQEGALAYAYVDGHVRVYSGKYKLPKAHVTRMRISLPAIQDVWLNDSDGSPVLSITQEAHPSLASALPPILEELRALVGERRVTVVFDRGGWSPALFRSLDNAGFDTLTYRKGAILPIPIDAFASYPAPDGGEPWVLHDASVRVPIGKKGFWMRQVTRLRGEHQTTVITTRQDLGAVEIAQRMFARWGQENFFKYMREEYALDALLEHGAEDEDPERDLPNPARGRLDRALRAAKVQLGRSLSKHRAGTHPDVEAADARVAELTAQRAALPQRVTVGNLAVATVRLPARLKRLSDAMKMVAWHIETGLARAIVPHYRRSAEEGRTLVVSALHCRGDLEVTADELRVKLAPMSSPHRTRAIATLCALLNETDTHFPGTRLRLRYSVRSG